jgi:PTS system nitrogen regulatory IIA component
MLKILVPVDESEQALRAVRHVASMFKGHRVSQVVLLNVQPPLEQGRACAYRSRDALRKLEEERGEAALRPARSILDDAGASYVAQVRSGEVVPAISQAVAANRCNAIVLGTTGRTPVGAVMTTRLANQLVRTSHVPVAVVASSGPTRDVVVHGASHPNRRREDPGILRWASSSQHGAGAKTSEEMMRIAAWLHPQDILLDVDARSRTHALELAAEVMCGAHGLDPAPVFRALRRREGAGSTALGEGLAIPHARIGGIARPITLFMRTGQPVSFDAPDGKLVSRLLVILVPEEGAHQDHLDLLALVARLFSDQDFRAHLDGARNATIASDAFRTGIARLVAASDRSMDITASNPA